MAPIRVLLTVPHLSKTASPYREMIAIARYLPRESFSLTICTLRDNGREQTGPELDKLGVPYFVARFRPTGRTLRHIWRSVKAQREIARHGHYDIQYSMDFTSSPFEAVFARLGGRRFIRQQRDLNENGHVQMLRIMLAFSDRIIAISESVDKFLQDFGVPSHKVEKIYCGLDFHEFDQQLSDTPNEAGDSAGSFLSVGHIVPRKRHEDAIRSLARVI
ncbi:MAG TPA: glycosyltransferase, partial [Aggregatilineales bacterium]|nr:glycosyltransferase [Aggregatilineales bacterium]